MSGETQETVNDRPPNWRADGKLYLVRCYACDPEHGTENYGPMVARGACGWCGWTDKEGVVA